MRTFNNQCINPKDFKVLDTSDLPKREFKPLKQEQAYRRPGSEEYKSYPSRMTATTSERYWI